MYKLTARKNGCMNNTHLEDVEEKVRNNKGVTYEFE